MTYPRDTWNARARVNWSRATGLQEWGRADDDRLCDIIADGHHFSHAAKLMGRTRASVKMRFKRIAIKMGVQAR